MFREIEVLSLSGVDPSWVASLIETQQGQDTNFCPARCRVQGEGVLTLTDLVV